MTTHSPDLRLIEHGFPCHQVGAQTRRERDSGNPPVMRLHVWWARRPLTPSRAAVIASLADSNSDPIAFIRQLGIEKKVCIIGDSVWTLDEKLHNRISKDEFGGEWLPIDGVASRAIAKELERRNSCTITIDTLLAAPQLSNNQILHRSASKGIDPPPDVGSSTTKDDDAFGWRL